MKDAAEKIRDLEQQLLVFAVDRDGKKVILLPKETVIIAEYGKRLLRVDDVVKALWQFSDESL